jgi:hypothetical protein
MGANGNPYRQLAHSGTWDYQPDASNITVRGWLSEALVIGNYTGGGTGTVTPFTPTVQFLDSATIALPSRIKTILIVVTTAFTLAAQAKVQLTSSRKAAAQAVGATTSYPDIPNEGGTVGAAANWGAATNPVAGAYWITPSEIPQLQWPMEYCGVEINFGAAPAAGALYCAFVVAPV